jgi:hypothetical protein
MDLDAAADELYGLPPSDLDGFAARRAELAAQARSAGDRELASRIGKLRKPVQAAALANALVRAQPAAVAELQDLGEALRDAHRHLRGAELRELSQRRQQVLARLTALGARGAAGRVGDTVLGQLRATFEAAIADQAAQEAVLSGRLTAALSYSGFGEVDLTDAVALPRRLAAVPAPEAPAAGPAAAEPPARGHTERALARARQAHTAALDGLDGAVLELERVRGAERELSGRIDGLERELAQAQQERDRVRQRVADAERAQARAERALDRAAAAVRHAEGGLTGPEKGT